MFNKFIKKSSKFLAVLLTATLALTPLSYAADVNTYEGLQDEIQASGSETEINVTDNITATNANPLGNQGADKLTINGNNNTINGEYTGGETPANVSGMKISEGQETNINNINFNNFSAEEKGAVINNNKGTLSVEKSSFSYNQAGEFGGAIRHKSNTDSVALTVKDSSFTANKAAIAGAVMIDGGYTKFEDTLFENNEAQTIGALGIFQSNSGDVTELNRVEFKGNKSTSTAESVHGYAGAVAVGAGTDVRIANNKFTNNEAAVDGGAISNKDLSGTGTYADGSLSIVSSSFTSNKAGNYGGAIDNYFYKSSNDNSTDAVYVNDSLFSGNEAKRGGAIYNHSAADGDGTAAKMLVENSTFTANFASERASAIYNEGNLTVKTSSFTGNGVKDNDKTSYGGAIFVGNSSITNIEDSYFGSNQAGVYGGAIFASSTAGDTTITGSVFENNYAGQFGGAVTSQNLLTVKESTFNNNSGEYGGAVYVKRTGEIKDSAFTGNNAAHGGAVYTDYAVSDLTISTTTFTENYAGGVGAVGLFNKATLKNNTFDGNYTTDSNNVDGSGAILIGADGVVVIDSNTFINNTSASNAGAIGTRRAEDADNSDAKLDIKDSSFISNVAVSSGGAINNYFYNSDSVSGSVSVDNTKFENNQAAYGGAIYNHGELDNAGNSAAMLIENSTFTANSASQYGGAIYNASTMTINSSKFENNIVGNENNDIYNAGQLNFNIGTTTFTGGITGNGSTYIGDEYNTNNSAYVELANEAKLEQAEISVAQNSELKANAANIRLTGNNDAVYNSGSLVLYSSATDTINFASSIRDAVNAGTTTIKTENNIGANIDMGDNVLQQYGLVIEEGSSLFVNSENLTISSKVVNSGDLVFNGGNSNSNIVEGTGNLRIETNLTNNNVISQSTVSVGSNYGFINTSSITANYVTANTLQNNGELILNLTEDAGYDITYLTGNVGTSSITVDAGNSVRINNTGSIEQQTIYTYGAGSLLLTGNKIVANIVNYMTGNCLDLATRIEGTLENNPANPDTEGVVNVLDGGSVSGQITNSSGTINITAGNFNVENGITSENTTDIAKNIINIGSTTARSVVVSTTAINYQTINVSSGSLTLLDEGSSNGTIDTSSVTVSAVSTFTANASRITNTTIQNDGLVQFVGGTETNPSINTSTITASNKGTLNINGVLENQEGTGISKQDIQVLETSTFTANASDITNSTIANAGELVFFGTSEMTNANVVSGLTDDDGNTIYGKLSIESALVNNANIEQYDIDVDADLTNNAQITAQGTLTNNLSLGNNSAIIAGTLRNEDTGVLTNNSGATVNVTDDFVNTGLVDNTGTITVANSDTRAVLTNGENATIINNAGGSISANSIINEDGALIENKASALIETLTLNNNGTIISTGSINANVLNNNEGASLFNEEYGVIVSTALTNNGAIVSSGSITTYRTLSNAYIASITNSSGTITAKEIDNNGLIDNAEKASISAEIFYNDYGGTINNLGAITVSDVLENEGIIRSTGSIEATNIVNENGGLIESYRTNAEGSEEYEGGTITSANQIENKGTITANASGVFAEIYNNGNGEAGNGVYNVMGGTVSYNVSGISVDKSTVNVQGQVTVSSNTFISQNNIILAQDSELILEKESNLRSSALNIGQNSTFNIMNGTVDTVDISSINVGDSITWNFKFDVDLKAGTTDMLTNTNFASNSTMTITTINVLQDTEKATTTSLTIADSYTYADILNTTFATTKVIYDVQQNMNVSTATVLNITADGYGGLPNAVYDGLNLYYVTGESEEDKNEYIRKWISDDHGIHDELIADMSINGNDTVLVSSPIATGDDPVSPVTGLKTGSFTLRINDKEDAKGLTVKGFENALNVNNTDGRLEANNVVFSSNTGNAVISNIGTVVLSSVTFSENTASIDVSNDGELILTGIASTFQKGIVGQGTTTIKGTAIDMGDAVLAQSRIDISDVAGSSLTVKVANLSTSTASGYSGTTELIMNHGDLVLIGNEGADAADLQTAVNGIGSTELQKSITVSTNIAQTNVNLASATVTVSDDAKITATALSVDEDSLLTVNADNIDTFATNGGINNEGNIVFVGGTNNNTITGEQGKIFIEMGKEVINSTGTKITQQFIEVKEDAKFVMNADDVETAIDDASSTNMFGIQNNGDLEITGGTNKNIIGRGDGAVQGNGNVIISGDVINEEGTSIEQSSITVNTGAQFTANASDLTAKEVANAGDLIFVGSNMVNTSTITGTGNLTVKSNLQNNNDIEQTNINIVDGIFEHNAADEYMPKITATNISVSTSATFIAHSEVEVSDKVTNDGIFKINVLQPTGEADDVTSENNIIGKGDLIISSTNYKNDGGLISQKTLTIEDIDSSFETDIANFEAYNGIVTEGRLIYTGTGISSSTIVSNNKTGELIIGTADTVADIINKEGNEVSLSTITVNEGSKFKANASNLITEAGIVNDGELTFTGGINNSTITRSRSGNEQLLVEGNLQNKAAIEQGTIIVNSDFFNNVRGSSITASQFTANTNFITDAYDLTISTITLGAEGSVLRLMDDEIQGKDIVLDSYIDGTGSIVKEGTGIVTLTGENEYEGFTAITAGAIRISSATNISDADDKNIYMNGGKLIIAGNTEINGNFVGTHYDTINDVNIEVEDVVTATATANSAIYGDGNLVKTGAGTLNLEMASNGYTGNTIVSSGTLRGTTANINGILFGTGSDKLDTFEFYDEGTDVVLNEVSDTDYIGTFNKTGSSTMTVTKYFKASDVNISSGTFVINNDADMISGDVYDFVATTMTVTNAMLKGYGDLTVDKLIIGAGATFAPGNSTTTYKVSGDMEFKDKSTYDVEFGQFSMDEEGHYNDNTTVGGTTTIEEDAKIVLNNLEGKYYAHETIDLINAGSLADFEYKGGDEEIDDSEGYNKITIGNVVFKDYDTRDLRPGYDTRITTRVYVQDNALKLDLERKASEYSTSVEFDRSHNEQEAANSIDTISELSNSGDITTALDAMEKFYYYNETYDIPALKAALNDIAGVIHANSTNLTFFNAKAEHVYDKIKGRTLDLYPCTKFHDKIWAEYYYNNYNVEKDENSPKYDSTVNGFLVGFDMLSVKGWTMGIMGGYGTSELKQREDKTSMNDINLGFYGGYIGKKWELKGMLLGGYEQYSIDRDIAFMERRATSDHKGYSAALDLEADYKIALNENSQSNHKLYLTPFIGVMGGYINNEGYEEKGGEDLNLKIEGYDNLTAEARAGLGIKGKVKKFGWYAKAGVRQLLTEKYNEIELSLLNFEEYSKMKIRSAENAQTTITGGIGADYDLSDNWTIFANGLGNFADASTNYYANVGLSYKFSCVNNKSREDEEVKQYLKDVQDEMKKKDDEIAKLQDKVKKYEQNEKDLKNRMQKYEANVVSEEKAQKMKKKVIKNMRLGEKPTFVFGTDKLNSRGKESLRQVARELENYPDADVLIEGHTDNVGSDEVNQKISENRASTVATTLKRDFNVKNDISVIGKGKKEPIASNATAEGRAKNRRVEIILTTDEEEVESMVNANANEVKTEAEVKSNDVKKDAEKAANEVKKDAEKTANEVKKEVKEAEVKAQNQVQNEKPVEATITGKEIK